MSRMGGSGSMSRMGGGGGMSRMGSGGFNQFGGNKPSPWEGGANPGPNPALAGAQAQLAIAITNLLQNQQSGNPPPLLSLNTSSGYQGGPPIRPGPRFQGRGDMMRPFGKVWGGSQDTIALIFSCL